ncbi:Sarcoglycan delta [Operophtera brumata]|uniref:Sarcoglycan delta n=1 Tax=Operophtera brumata TaxID=104452 RepID=A0A0L7LSN0_OPEBR|nr:Sarcoglycan delta [Operophtera brumata]
MSVEGSSVSVIRGWGCTPTGEPPPAALPSEPRANKACLPTIFQRGWRRNALYGIILFLILLNGIGPVRIVSGGIQLDGQAWVLDNLVASTISSQVGQPVTLHSHRNFSVLVSESNGKEQSKFIMNNVFRASRDEVRVFAETFAVEGVGGITVKSAIQAPLVRAPPASDLQLESLTRTLSLRAPKSIVLESRAGNIDVTAHGHIDLKSTAGAAVAAEPDRTQKNLRIKKVYQLCVCASGKLFLAAPEAPCVASVDDVEICR